jgi:hypothetical protein
MEEVFFRAKKRVGKKEMEEGFFKPKRKDGRRCRDENGFHLSTSTSF